MIWLAIAVLAALAAAFFWFPHWTGQGGRLSRHPYQKNTTLFSADDRAFFPPLKEAVAGEYEIFGKIWAGDIIVAKKSASVIAFADQHFDFVLCDKTSLAVVCVIQLHDKASRQAEADAFQPICENLGLPFVRFHVKAEYAVDEVREKLRKAMVDKEEPPFYLVETDGRKEPRISNIEDMKF